MKKSYDNWLIKTALIIALPLGLLSLGLIWFLELAIEWRWSLTALVALMMMWLPWYINNRLIGPLRDIANGVLALKDGDFSLTLNAHQYDGVLGQTATGLNQLSDQLYRTRTDAIETHELLKKVLTQIDVVVMSFNQQNQLVSVNEKGLALLGLGRSDAIGQSAEVLGLSSCLQGAVERTEVLQAIAPEQVWQLHRSNYREKGKVHTLLTLSDLTAVLTEQELDAWQRMMRVLRHEISNSLAPVQSYAQTIEWLINSKPLADNWLTESQQGLAVIISRTKALNELMNQHRELTDLSKPQLQQVKLVDWLAQVVKLETRRVVEIVSSEEFKDIEVNIDIEQLNRLMLNLLKNAAEAMLDLPVEQQISVSLVKSGHGLNSNSQQHYVSINIDDRGAGLASFDNLFVPFFTTKPQGSGIGLALSRQIATAHDGFLHLQNRPEGGCRAILSLPVVYSGS